MRAISLRPPLGNATAYWGRHNVPREEIPSPNMLGTEIAIHQGKRWDDVARLRASTFAAAIKEFKVPLEHKGYPQGVVAVATLGAFIDFTGVVSVKLAEQMGYPAKEINFAWCDEGRAGTFSPEEGDDLPDGAQSAVGVLVAYSGAFGSLGAAVDFAIDAVTSVRDWGDAIEGALWCFRKVTPLMNAVGCAGKHGVFNLDRNTMDAVRQRLRS